MGSKELFLIVLGIIIVGAAIVLGIHLFQNNSVHQHQTALVNQMNKFVADAMAHQRTPKVLGGGGGAFEGFQPPGAKEIQGSKNTVNAARAELEDAIYYFEYFKNGRMRITASSNLHGKGKRTGNKNSCRIVAVYKKDGTITNAGYKFVGPW